MNYNATRENFSTIGFMGQNDRSYDLGVQQAQQGGSNQRVGSYNLGVQQAQQGGSNQRVGSYTDNFGNDSAVCYNNPLAEVFTKKSAASVALQMEHLAEICITPDHAKQFENHRRSVMLSFSVDESSSQEKDKIENLLSSSEAIEDHCTGLLRNIVDSSSAAVSTSLMEKNNLVGGDQGIDLNKTPQLKPPKRRKHRPKVVVEGKPKRTPKPKPPMDSNSKETPSGKRKYVRKKPIMTKEEPKEKSCKMK
ncbi:hypothetical protein C3L33_02708, partial [Rhododendron williamsianum]